VVMDGAVDVNVVVGNYLQIEISKLRVKNGESPQGFRYSNNSGRRRSAGRWWKYAREAKRIVSNCVQTNAAYFEFWRTKEEARDSTGTAQSQFRLRAEENCSFSNSDILTFLRYSKGDAVSVMNWPNKASNGEFFISNLWQSVSRE
jgi:hypothetical protein